LAQRSSRKRRKERRRSENGVAAANGQGAMARGYSRSRAKDEAARAALEPLAPGERPTAVTVGAIVAAVAAAANLVALAIGYDPDKGRDTTATLIGAFLLIVVAVGMWRAKYWAVLGMQTLLAITLIISSLMIVGTTTWRGTFLALALIAGSGTLFWFLVKAMARIQMPERPGAESR
jgi:hypothetical protein